MAVRFFLVLVTVLAFVEFLGASPTRRQLISITESSVSESPVTSDGTVWDDNDEFDLDGEQDGWLSRAAVSPSAAPEKTLEYNEYEEDYSHGNGMADFGDDDDDEQDDNQEQEAEEDDDDNSQDSKFIYVRPKDTRLLLEDADNDHSEPIKVRHTGRNSYPRVFDGSVNSVESSEEEEEEDKDYEHPYEFAIDEDDNDGDDDDDGETRKQDDNTETRARHEEQEDEDDEDDFVSEVGEGDVFDNPEEEAAQVIYGDHVFLY